MVGSECVFVNLNEKKYSNRIFSSLSNFILISLSIHNNIDAELNILDILIKTTYIKLPLLFLMLAIF